MTLDISQGSVATQLKCDRIFAEKMFAWFWEQTNFENRLTLGKERRTKHVSIFGPPCMSVRSCNSEPIRPNFTIFFQTCYSPPLWLDPLLTTMFYTSGFVDDVMFSRNRAMWQNQRHDAMLRWIRQVHGGTGSKLTPGNAPRRSMTSLPFLYSERELIKVFHFHVLHFQPSQGSACRRYVGEGGKKVK